MAAGYKKALRDISGQVAVIAEDFKRRAPKKAALAAIVKVLKDNGFSPTLDVEEE